jgi:hypothetical protein
VRTLWISGLVVVVLGLGCAAEYRRKDRATRAKQEELQRQLLASEEARKKAAIALDGLAVAIRAKDGEIASLESKLEDKKSELTRLERASLTSGTLTEELKAKIAGAEAARDKAAEELKIARDDRERLKKSLEERRTRSLQAFLENAGPETMFAADSSDIEKIFAVQGRECAVVLDIARDLEVMRGTQRDSLPILRGYNVLPMRVAYQKVLVCKKDAGFQVQREAGYLFRLISQGNDSERALMSSRTTGSCDGRSEALLEKSVFGASRYQLLSPFRGSIDGIETMDLPRGSRGALRLTMGSSVVGAVSCARAVEMRDASDMTTMACKVLLGQTLAGARLAEGCFTEEPEGSATSLNFHQE